MKKNALLLVLSLLSCFVARAAENKTRNVLLVTIDGLRWQEVFRGADEAFMNKEKNSGGVPAGELVALKADFLGATAEERRKKLMPFFWAHSSPADRRLVTATTAAPQVCSTLSGFLIRVIMNY